MAIAAGTRFGPYEVAEQIGAGGMGEVYRATDTNLKRDVAIKVLPESFAEDAERLARFQREAEVLASLNHPHIAQVYGLEKADGRAAIVMELIEGPTLADRIAAGPLPPDEALTIARQIAMALEVAHGRQIVHRDLKPANVKITTDGAVKVLDFGIAKAIDVGGTSGSPVMTTPAVTQTGLILGTAAYMSPEQARGSFVDQRTDIWAFGCLLFEMLTGQPAFAGEDVMATLARIIDRDTDLSSMPGTLSPAVRHTIRLCLTKDPKKRIADIRDVRLALDGTFESELPTVTEAPEATPAWRRALPVAAALVLGLAATIAVWISMQPAPGPIDRFVHTPPPDQQIRMNPVHTPIAISPDGRRFVYATAEGLYLREMGEIEARLIPGTVEQPRLPFFSPDGQSLAYLTDGGVLKRIAISGGAAVEISDGIGNTGGAYWASDNMVYFSAPAPDGSAIFRVSANGGTPEIVVDDEGFEYGMPQLLPDGETLLFAVRSSAGNWNGADIVTQSVVTGERTVLVPGGSHPRYLTTGHLVYSFEDTLRGIAFDVDTLSVSGGSVSLVQGVTRSPFFAPFGYYDIAQDGTLVYIVGGSILTELVSHVWVDRNGREEPLGLDPCVCLHPVISPDGTQVAFSVLSDAADDADIWIWSLTQDTFRRLTFEENLQIVSAWTKDGTRIAYATPGTGILWRLANGTGQVAQLFQGPALAAPLAFTDDERLLFATNPSGQYDILSVSIGDSVGDLAAEPLIATEFGEAGLSLSPDGRWLAYESDETGAVEIYVRPYPGVDDGKWQISSGGGDEPRWSSDGQRLYFISRGQLMQATIAIDDGFSRTLAPVVDLSRYQPDPAPGLPFAYDVAPDDERFLVVKPGALDGTVPAARVVIVQNWFEDVLDKIPVQ